MKADRIRGVNPSLLLGHVRDGRSIKLFNNEDMAAEFIAIVKMYDPHDDLIYVIYPHPTLAQKFIVAIFSPPGLAGESTFAPAPPVSAMKALQKKAA